MRKSRKYDKKHVVARLRSARLTLPDPWPQIEGRIFSTVSTPAREQIPTDPVRTPRTVRSTRGARRWVLVANVVLLVAIAAVAGIVLAGKNLPASRGTDAPGVVPTTPSEAADLPGYPADARWVTLQFRSNALLIAESGTVEGLERFDPVSGTWVQAAPDYAYTFQRDAEPRRIPDSWRFAMVDLERFPLEPGRYRATMSLSLQGGATTASEVEFAILAAGNHPELAQAIIQDPRAAPDQFFYRPAGLSWGMEKAGVLTALGLTEEDWEGRGDVYTCKEPVRYRFPDVHATATYVFTQGRLTEARYEIAPLAPQTLMLECGQLLALRGGLLGDAYAMKVEVAYFSCLLTSGSRGASVGGLLDVRSTINGAYVTVREGPVAAPPLQIYPIAEPFAWLGKVPQYAAEAEAIVLTVRHPALAEATTLDIVYERLRADGETWERVMTQHATQHRLYLGDRRIETAIGDGYTYSVRIGDPAFEAPLGAGHYRARVTLWNDSVPADPVHCGVTYALFDLVATD